MAGGKREAIDLIEMDPFEIYNGFTLASSQMNRKETGLISGETMSHGWQTADKCGVETP